MLDSLDATETSRGPPTGSTGAVATSNGASPCSQRTVCTCEDRDRASAVSASSSAARFRAARPDAYALEPEPVIPAALRGAGPAGLGDPAYWCEGLDRFLASAREDGRLNAVGARTARGTAVAALRARLAMNRLRRTGRPLRQPPIFITGGWRTGTAFLHRLLAADLRLRAPLPAELAVPWKFAGASRQKREGLIQSGSGANDLLNSLNPGLAAVHDHGPRLPEECVVGMNSAFRNWGLSATVRLDGYSRWLAGQDLTGTYLDYRHVLAAFDAADGRRWVLKWAGYHDLVELREISGLGPYIRQAPSRPWSRDEVAYRVATMRQRNTEAIWNSPPRLP